MKATEDAIASRAGAYRGIALLPTDVPDAELRRLDAAGFRGVRFNYMGHLGHATPIDAVRALARRIAPLGFGQSSPPGAVPSVAQPWRPAASTVTAIRGARPAHETGRVGARCFVAPLRRGWA